MTGYHHQQFSETMLGKAGGQLQTDPQGISEEVAKYRQQNKLRKSSEDVAIKFLPDCLNRRISSPTKLKAERDLKVQDYTEGSA